MLHGLIYISWYILESGQYFIHFFFSKEYFQWIWRWIPWCTEAYNNGWFDSSLFKDEKFQRILWGRYLLLTPRSKLNSSDPVLSLRAACFHMLQKFWFDWLLIVAGVEWKLVKSVVVLSHNPQLSFKWFSLKAHELWFVYFSYEKNIPSWYRKPLYWRNVLVS